ncbi:MAG: 50S ribosomal protein L3 [Candidatus Thermoplasmatota archaeon]|nr:50S ribosomal protein L3 [Candidatus Thermoplasmatota archaeon]
MAKPHRPRRGSMGYSPRKRAKKETPNVRSWPEGGQEPKIQGFAGYKAGMTHAFVVDYRPTSTTSGQEVQIPVTVVEVPPLKVAGIRLYREDPYGMTSCAEVWAQKLDKELARRLPIPSKGGKPDLKLLDVEDPDEIRIIVHTLPGLVTGTPKKSPELMEIRIGGGTTKQRIEYAKGLLGKEIPFNEFQVEGAMVDIVAVTKGKGFTGRVKRFNVKLLVHKNSKHRRMIGTQGAFHPGLVASTVPNSGQMGYHKRTEHNKRILKIGKDGAEITPKGGFLHYGLVQNNYVLIHGSIPGPTKRLIRFRDPVRLSGVEVKVPDLTYISTASKQGR